MGQVGELMTQQALARTRQPGKEHAALGAQPLQVGIEPCVCCGNEERIGQRCSTHEWQRASIGYALAFSVIETGSIPPLGRF